MILCGEPPGSTRAFSPRQLPTDDDYAVSTREYQSDQPSRSALRPPPMLRILEIGRVMTWPSVCAPLLREALLAGLDDGAEAMKRSNKTS